MLTAAALLVVAVLFGGGGSRAGIANLVVQLAALIAIAFHRDAFFGFFKEAPRAVAALVSVTVLLPLLQCVPLPPVIWHQLPGRELAVESLELIGQENTWMPFSVNAQRTFIAFLSLLPPLATLVLTWRATEKGQRLLLAALVLCAILGVVLGTQQLSSGNRNFILYAQGLGSADLQGTFANRNTAGLFANVALCALIGLLWRPPISLTRVGVSAFGSALLVLGVFLTRSRSSMVLMIIPAAMFFILLWKYRSKLYEKRFAAYMMLAVVVVSIASVGLLYSNARVQHSLSRFDTLKDVRPFIWEDTKSSIIRFWPLGSGVGTFDEVFQLDESLENLGPGRAARAHNEYLETTLEAGMLGPIIVGLWLVSISVLALKASRKEASPGIQITSIGVFLLLVLQSFLDYPLRSQTLLCVAGLMLGMLIERPIAQPISGHKTRSKQSAEHPQLASS